MSPKVGTSISASRLRQIPAASPVQGDVFVSSQNGIDGGAGTLDDPVDSLDEVSGLVSSGDLVRIERGSTFSYDGGRMDLPGAVDVEPYGTGDLAFVDLSTPLDPSAWSLNVGWDNNYKQAVSAPSGPVSTVRLFDEGDQTVQRGSVAQVDSNPGSCYVDKSGDSWIIYFHPKDSTDPSSNGREVRWTAGFHAVRFGFGGDPGGRIEGLYARRPLANDGAFVAGPGGVIERCIAEEGGKHHFLHQGGVTRDVIARGDTTRGYLDATAVVYFHDSNVTQVQPHVCVRYGVRAKSTNPVYGHNTGGAGFDDAVSVGEWRHKCTVPGQVSGQYEAYGWQSYKTGGIPQGQSDGSLIEGAYVDDIGGGGADSKAKHSFTIRDSIILDTQLVRDPASSGKTFTFENCVIFIIDQDMLRDVSGQGGHTTIFKNCVLANAGLNTSLPLGSVQGENNVIFYGSPTHETQVAGKRSLSDLEANTGLSNNAWLTISQWKSLIGDAQLRKGNVQLPASPDVTHPDGTVAQTLPDGTSISEVGPQKRLDIKASDADETGTDLIWVQEAPSQWPTPPTTDAEEEAYIEDPNAWDWQGTPRDHVVEIPANPLGFWKMDGSGGEVDSVGGVDLSENGTVGAGSSADFSYRTFGDTDYLSADGSSYLTERHDRLWIAFPFRYQSTTGRLDWYRAFSESQFRFLVLDSSTVSLQMYGGPKLEDITPFSDDFSATQGSWHIAQLWHDRGTGVSGGRIDDVESTGTQTYQQTQGPDANQVNFVVGGGGYVGDIGPIMYAGSAPSKADRDWLYNSGSYRTLSEIQNRTVTVKEI